MLVAMWMQHARDDGGMDHCGYDPWRIDELMREVERHGIATTRHGSKFADPSAIVLHPHPQGFVSRGKSGLAMSQSLDACEKAILQGKLRIVNDGPQEVNPLIRAAILGAAVIKDASGNRRLNKSKSTTRIDAAIAMIIAVGLAELELTRGASLDAWDMNAS